MEYFSSMHSAPHIVKSLKMQWRKWSNRILFFGSSYGTPCTQNKNWIFLMIGVHFFEILWSGQHYNMLTTYLWLSQLRNQVTFEDEVTFMAKECFAQWLWELTAKICHLYCDNGIFNAELFLEDCKNKFHNQSIAWVSTNHQNALAELSFQTIYMAWTIMIFVYAHWKKYCAYNLVLWVLLWNMLFGFTIEFPFISLISHQWNYSPWPRPISVIFSVHKVGDAWSVSLIQS